VTEEPQVPASPPPPPPPPPPAARQGFDFAKPFSFTFEDPEWVQKILLGGVFVLASIVIVGIFFVYGYLARLVRNVVEGVQYPLPAWDDLGDYFTEGLRLFAVGIVYALPIVGLAMSMVFPAIAMEATDIEVLHNFGQAMAGCVWCIMFPASLALAIWLPAALLFAAVDRRFGAAFEFGRIWSFIKANAANYALAYVAWLIARFIAPFGLVLFCIGIIFTIFWSMVVAAYSFGQTYRLSQVK
jgi:Protein of unknown function (DUF4013)